MRSGLLVTLSGMAVTSFVVAMGILVGNGSIYLATLKTDLRQVVEIQSKILERDFERQQIMEQLIRELSKLSPNLQLSQLQDRLRRVEDNLRVDWQSLGNPWNIPFRKRKD